MRALLTNRFLRALLRFRLLRLECLRWGAGAFGLAAGRVGYAIEPDSSLGPSVRTNAKGWGTLHFGRDPSGPWSLR